MGDKITLTLSKRTEQGKKVARLRKEGLVPGVIYGQDFEPILVQSKYGDIEKVVREAGRHTPVVVTVDGKTKTTLIKDIDRDPVKATIRNVSFHAVKANEHVVTEVSIVLTGTNESEAVKAGLVVLQAIETVEVKAKPADLPSELTLDATQLAKEGDKLTLGDIILPAGVEFADVDENLGLVVANDYEPAALEAANEAASGAATDTVPPEAAEAASGESASKASTDGEASK